MASTARVEKTLAAPIDRVFELLTDHANYSRFPGIQRSELIREGDTERNGVGAVRRIESRPLRFDEKVTRFESPTRLDYLITEVNAPMTHQGASIELEDRDGATHVTWTSTTEFTVPLIGPLMGAAFSPILRRGFGNVLDEAERLAAAAEPAGTSSAA